MSVGGAIKLTNQPKQYSNKNCAKTSNLASTDHGASTNPNASKYSNRDLDYGHNLSKHKYHKELIQVHKKRLSPIQDVPTNSNVNNTRTDKYRKPQSQHRPERHKNSVSSDNLTRPPRPHRREQHSKSKYDKLAGNVAPQIDSNRAFDVVCQYKQNNDYTHSLDRVSIPETIEDSDGASTTSGSYVLDTDDQRLDLGSIGQVGSFV